MGGRGEAPAAEQPPQQPRTQGVLGGGGVGGGGQAGEALTSSTACESAWANTAAFLPHSKVGRCVQGTQREPHPTTPTFTPASCSAAASSAPPLLPVAAGVAPASAAGLRGAPKPGGGPAYRSSSREDAAEVLPSRTTNCAGHLGEQCRSSPSACRQVVR